MDSPLHAQGLLLYAVRDSRMSPMKKKKPQTLQEFAQMGGKARAKKLSKTRKKEIATKAAEDRWKQSRKK